MITQSRLKERLHYDPETGVFEWLVKPRSAKKGEIVGGVGKNGYWRIAVDGERYLAHRLAWMYVYGKWPDDEIDHKNGNKLDNRISNLREASRSQNLANTKTRKDSTHGLKGVSFHKRDGKYMTRIMAEKKRIMIGYYLTAEAAHEAYRIASEHYYGDYARHRS